MSMSKEDIDTVGELLTLSGLESTVSPARHTTMTAPAFELPGVAGTTVDLFELEDLIDNEVAVITFVPSDRLGQTDFMNWFQLSESMTGIVITDASQHTCLEHVRESRAVFPLLSDHSREVASQYGLSYRDGNGGDACGGVFLLDRRGRVRYGWPFNAGLDRITVHETARRLATGVGINGNGRNL